MSGDLEKSKVNSEDLVQGRVLRVCFFVALLFSVIGTFLLPGLSIGGTGVAIILFAMLFSYAVALINSGNLPDLGVSVRIVLFGSFCFVLVTVCAFVIGGHLKSLDLRYLASFATIPFWFPFLRWSMAMQPRLLGNMFSLGFAIVAVGLIVIAVLLIVQTRDVFVFRNSIFDSSFWAYTVGANGNEFARTCLALLITQLVEWDGGRCERNRRRAMVLSLALLVLIVLTLSRSNIVAAVILYAVFLFMHNRGILRILGFLALPGLVIGLALSPSFVDRWNDTMQFFDAEFMNTDSDELRPRLRSLKATIECISDNPMLGVGRSGELVEMSRRGAVKGPDSKPIAVHGTLLKILVYSGVIGLFGFIVFVFLTAYALARREPIEDEHMAHASRRIGAYGLAFLAALLISSIGADGFLQISSQFTLAWLIAIKVGVGSTVSSSDEELMVD